jgi:hypothetical protein
MVRLLAKGLLFAVTLAGLLIGFEHVLTSRTNWRRYADPRARILWDGTYDGTGIVLLGGSEFASVYSQSPSQTLWSRLEAYTGQRVFPGALNGARVPDVVAATIHVSREWPAGTRVFISLPPTRFVASRAPEPPEGNFASAFLRRYGIDGNNDDRWHRFKGMIYIWLLKPFTGDRTRSALVNLVDRPQPPPWMRHRVWSREQVAQTRFENLDRNLIVGASPRPLESLGRIKDELERAGMRSVFVLTPLNETLVRAFATVHPSESILEYIHETIAAAKTALSRHHAEVIDLTGAVPSECFFDLVHVNTCGDDLMATEIATWIAEHPQD